MSISIVPIIIILVIVIIGMIVLTVLGLRKPDDSSSEILQKRLEELSQKGEQVTLEKIEMSQPFTERVVFPIARKMGEIAVKFTPQNALQATAKKLELSGTSSKIDPTMFLAVQFLAAMVFGALFFFLFTFGQIKMGPGMNFIIALGAAALGFYYPQLQLTSRINKRQSAVRRGMPDALDLLTICVEAGLGFDAAMQKVSEKWDNELSAAFGRVTREIQLGKIRREALRDMSDRLGLSEMTSFVAAVIQSEQLGVSLSKVLRIQSDQMRIRRRQRAEEEAHKAPIKMLIPMALLIFPSLMLTLMTPAALRIAQQFFPGLFAK
jgi:tight adherence protein C